MNYMLHIQTPVYITEKPEYSKYKEFFENNVPVPLWREFVFFFRTCKKNWVRTTLLEAQNHRCCYCGTAVFVGEKPRFAYKKTRATIEHVLPRTHGGSNDPSNLVIACYACNSERGDRDLEEFLRCEVTQNKIRNRFLMQQKMMT